MDLGQLPADRLFLVSDTHFGHVNIIPYSKRPFANIDDMNDEMVRRWCATVPNEGIVLHLGDFAMGKIDDRVLTRYGHLTGCRKVLVAGNHDSALVKRGYAAQLFHEVYDAVTFRVGSTTVHAQHYPVEAGSWRETIHLHGHAHGMSARVPGRLDVGVDAMPNRTYAPQLWEEIVGRVPR